MIIVTVHEGCITFLKNGKYHRLHGPAKIWSHGDISWWKNGKRHRMNGPVMVLNDGTKIWYKHGKWKVST